METALKTEMTNARTAKTLNILFIDKSPLMKNLQRNFNFVPVIL